MHQRAFKWTTALYNSDVDSNGPRGDDPGQHAGVDASARLSDCAMRHSIAMPLKPLPASAALATRTYVALVSYRAALSCHMNPLTTCQMATAAPTVRVAQ